MAKPGPRHGFACLAAHFRSVRRELSGNRNSEESRQMLRTSPADLAHPRRDYGQAPTEGQG